MNVQDLLAVIGEWGPCPAPCPDYCLGDVVQDCVVNTSDVLYVIGNWGPCPLGLTGGGGGSGQMAPQTIQDCHTSCADLFPGRDQDYADCVEACIESLCMRGLIECGD